MGLVVAIVGAKDGVGKTTLAIHLAYGLSKMQPAKSVCLLEADAANLGDMNVALNIKNNKTFVDFARQSSRLDAKLTQNYIGKSPSGIFVLGGASFVTDLQNLDDASCDRSLKLLQRSFDFTIVDAGRDLNPLTFRILENSHLIFLVTNSNLLSINQTAELAKRLRLLHFGSEIQRLVVNQYDSTKSLISPAILKQKFLIEPSIILPDDSSALNQALGQAKPLQIINPKHPYLKGIDDAMRLVLSSEGLVNKATVGGEKSKIGRPTAAGQTQPLDVLRQVVPFFFGDSPAGGISGGGIANKKLMERGSTPNPILDRNLAIRARVHDRLLELVDLKEMDVVQLEKDPKKKEELKGKTSQAVQRLLEEEAKEVENRAERAQLAKDILDEALGLGAVEPLLEDPAVSEIMVNGKDMIFVERKGKITLTDYRFTSDKHLLGCIERIVSPIGRRVDEKTPLCDARLKDGSRINIIIPPLSLKGPIITIRKFFKEKLTVTDLIKYGSLTEEMADFLRAAVESRLNIVVSGGTGTGKTTLLNKISEFIPEGERIVTIEDAAEIQLPQPHVITLEARPANLQGEGAIHIRDLVKNSLRMRPDRIIVGECRSGEALDMLQAMNTGHDGSLTTIHSNNPRDCIRRIETLVMMAGFDLPITAIREQIASAVNLIVQLKRYSDGSRRISNITEVIGIEGETIVTQPIFEFKQTGTEENGKVKGGFQPSGLIPKFVETLKAKGIAIPKGLFGSQGGSSRPSASSENTPSGMSAPSKTIPTRPMAPSSRPMPAQGAPAAKQMPSQNPFAKPSIGTASPQTPVVPNQQGTKKS